ncbi:MAG: PHP domain-containing protein [Bdellovibrionales bacterium]|nr:PHP domain-containing protein [Bdellovibrionales bacterium]
MKAIVDLLTEMKTLLEMNGENPFKVRAFDKAADTVESLGDSEDWVGRAKAGTLTEIPGIGKGISALLTEFLLEGTAKERDALAAKLPEGLLELTKVPGLGPKKAIQVIETLGIKTLGELEYACRENRLLKLKGFGEKVQAKILEGVQYLMATSGQMKLAEAFPIAERLLPALAKTANEGRHPAGGGLRVSETGALRRRMETLSSLDFLVETLPGAKTTKQLEERLYGAVTALDGGIPLAVKFTFAETARYGTELAHTTATEASWSALVPGRDSAAGGAPAADTEEKFFAEVHVPWIPPEMRETGEEVALARTGKLDEIVGWNDLQGCFHNHTTRSDGVATLEEMVVGAKARGMKYIGISDHSKSAFYAQGLAEAALAEQEKEIRAVQEKHPDIRIFWGIESDILADGALDYDAKWLDRFDFVVASIHSRFQMDRTTMTERILQAVRNPRTTMLGHLTGRLLLGRKGYELDIEKIISECAARKVAIEINAHPARLDIDWRWGPELRKAGCLVSVNPDAHEVAGLDDVKYGLCVARKALLPRGLVLNARDRAGVEKWLAERR